MIPQVGATCYFEFATKFAALNGVYRVLSGMTFNDCIAAGISLVDNLYQPVGLSSSDYAADYASYTNSLVAVLESVIDSSIVIYVPDTLFSKVPDPTVHEYLPLTLVVNLGVYANPQVVLPLIDQVKDLVEASVGMKDPVYVTGNPQKKVYLTDAQYALVEAARAQNVQALMPLSVQLRQEQLLVTELRARLAAYEEKLGVISQAS